MYNLMLLELPFLFEDIVTIRMVTGIRLLAWENLMYSLLVIHQQTISLQDSTTTVNVTNVRLRCLEAGRTKHWCGAVG